MVKKCLGRRLLALALRELAEHLDMAAADATSGKPLFVAESQFREAYLSAVLAKSRNKRQAAELAGLPYRTLCQMLATFRIGFGDVEPDRPRFGSSQIRRRVTKPRSESHLPLAQQRLGHSTMFKKKGCYWHRTLESSTGQFALSPPKKTFQRPEVGS